MEVQTCGKPLDTLLERVLCTNILSSDYFKELFSLKTYTEVVDEIYNQVDHVEPWMTGNCRGPSTAFCLLYKLFTMKFTVKQMQGLLNHGDSPYIRAIGFLYLRYVGDPKTLWGWFEQYVTDDEEFSPGSNGRMTTMGVFVRDLLLDQYYFDTLFPRIPVPILRQITAHLERMKLPTQPAGVTGTSGRHGGDDTARRPPSVKAALSVSFGQRAPHRAFTRDSSPVRRTAPVREPVRNGVDDSRKQAKADRDIRDRERERERENDRGKDVDRERDRDRNSRDQERDRARGRDREQEREKERPRERERERSRDRDHREGSRGRGKDDRDRESGRDYSRLRDVERNRDNGRDRPREREQERVRDRRRDWSVERERGKERERERRYDDYDRQRSRSPGRPSGSADCFGSRSPTKPSSAPSNLKKLMDVYGDASDKKSKDANDSNFHSEQANNEDVLHLGNSRWR